MNIELKNNTGTLINIDGKEFNRTMIFQTAHGMCIRYANADDARKTVTFRKESMLKKDPAAARVLFDPRNWID